MLYIYCNSPDYAAVYPGAIINPCQKQPVPLTTTGDDVSQSKFNNHWNVLLAFAGVMNVPSDVIYWVPFEGCSIRAIPLPFW